MSSGRCMILWIAPHHILSLFRWWQHDHIVLPILEKCADVEGKLFPLPVDVKVLDVHYKIQRKAFGLLLEHESFAEVPETNEFPSLSFTEITLVASPEVAQDDLPVPTIVEESA